MDYNTRRPSTNKSKPDYFSALEQVLITPTIFLLKIFLLLVYFAGYLYKRHFWKNAE